MSNFRDSYDLEEAHFKHYKIMYFMFKIKMFPKVMNFKIYKTINVLIWFKEVTLGIWENVIGM